MISASVSLRCFAQSESTQSMLCGTGLSSKTASAGKGAGGFNAEEEIKTIIRYYLVGVDERLHTKTKYNPNALTITSIADARLLSLYRSLQVLY